MIAENGIRLTEEEQKRRRNRSVALGLVLGGLAILFFWVTIAKIGAAIFARPL